MGQFVKKCAEQDFNYWIYPYHVNSLSSIIKWVLNINTEWEICHRKGSQSRYHMYKERYLLLNKTLSAERFIIKKTSSVSKVAYFFKQISE